MEPPEKKLANAWQPQEIAIFKSLSYPIQAEPGYMIWGEEDISDCIYFLETGYVKVYHNDNLGRMSIISIRKSGDILGIGGVLTGKLRCVFVETIDSCKLWRMDADVFIDMLYKYPRMSLLIASIHSKYLRDAERAIGELLLMDTGQRLAWLLLRLTTTSPPPAKEQYCMGVKLTHQDMARMIGSCRQTVTAILNQFKGEGLISIDRKAIKSVDPKKLTKYLCHGKFTSSSL
jgi:CRP/FNR family cyclic AMP-dependent transcriptional regulator